MKKIITNNLLISNTARKKYQFDTKTFKESNRIFFKSLYDIRKFTNELNAKRNVLEFPEQAVNTGNIYGMSLIQNIFQYILEKYEKENKESFDKCLTFINENFDEKYIEKTLITYIKEFPVEEIYSNNVTPDNYIRNIKKSKTDYINIIKELGNIHLYNSNPAFSKFSELFDDKKLKRSEYRNIWNALNKFFETQPKFGPDNQNLMELLATPAKMAPQSIQGQLEWIRTNWNDFLDEYLYNVLISLDLIAEENKHHGLSPGPAYEHRFDNIDHEHEYEKFSKDLDWMPKVVILAKNTHVWLQQLSDKYKMEIKHLNQIPDQELDILQKRGMTSLWLIGLWERSVASKKIKQIMGNQDAVASAYSLLDYSISNELGGENAYLNLKERAIKRGIRLCGDMVPNHVGIDANWVINHPDWFVSSDHPPFPSYSFTGINLCNDDRVGIYLEDHYFEKSDAAVVFKRVDHYTGDEKYIYHGNDGTSMPWNDTAQLNYLKKEVREAVIQTILHVARNFDIIRFDAAMTLAKKHYQRLWFPQPGTGGDIPSRAEHAMTREEFNSFFPTEFWREVVDRVKAEEPNTLLLAEAFWMMEGYFVRTLGMHRVYNSAFMNMLKNEDNEKYRNSIKNVLEFNPEILKRYVNFMNNPDEDTAVVQFGDGDKYFGICLLMATMPGLPMFGHGQVEGLREKYGMEFKRAYWNETPNQHLITRHEKDIFPLLHKRYLFSEVTNFHLYDYVNNDGHVNQNVFAYSNSAGSEKALIIYNNSYTQTSGWIKNSVQKRNSKDELYSTDLAKTFNLQVSNNHYTIFRDQISNLEYIRPNREISEQGIFTILDGFKYHAFMDFREVEDSDGLYHEVVNFLDGRGVRNVELAIQQILVKPVHVALKKNLNKQKLDEFFDIKILEENQTLYKNNNLLFLESIKNFTETSGNIRMINQEFGKSLDNFLFIMSDKSNSEEIDSIKKVFDEQLKSKENQIVLFSWMMLRYIGKLFQKEDWEKRSRSSIEELFFNKLINELSLQNEIRDDQFINNILLILTEYQNWLFQLQKSEKNLNEIIKEFLSDFNVRNFVNINRYNSILWFNKESLEILIQWLELVSYFSILEKNYPSLQNISTDLSEMRKFINKIKNAVQDSDYKLEKFLDNIE